jgi:insertion element IS1 protein InsB
VLQQATQPESIAVVIQRVDEAELDELWSFVGNKKPQRGLWHALNHASGTVLAYG